jgi:hypothetical protein
VDFDVAGLDPAIELDLRAAEIGSFATVPPAGRHDLDGTAGIGAQAVLAQELVIPEALNEVLRDGHKPGFADTARLPAHAAVLFREPY